MKHFLSLLLLSLFSYSFAQIEYAKEICKELTSEKYYGRGYLRNGSNLAADFIANEYKNIGLKPIKKTYFQEFTFPVNIFPNDIELVINGKKLNVGSDFLPFAESGDFTGQWKFTEIKKEDITNLSKIRLIRDSVLANYYNSVIIYADGLKNDTLSKAYEISHLLLNFCHVLYVVDNHSGHPINSEKHKYSGFKVVKSAVDYEIREISSSLKSEFIPNQQAKNVIGLIPSKNKKAPYIFITAHYDHLGGIGNQVYFPGASDNASGVATMLSLAKHYVQNPSTYNLVFIAFAAEEVGILGSKYFTEHPTIPLSKIRIVLNLDLMANGEDGITVVNGKVFTKEFDLLKEINEEKQLLPAINSRGKAKNSDHYYFSEKGIPSFFIYTLGKNKNYHDIFDTYEALEFPKFEEILTLIKEMIKRLD